MGTDVLLISLQYVVPFVETNKNDRSDVEAIVEAASQPTMHFVPIKSVRAAKHLGSASRAILLRHRTALINQMRGLFWRTWFRVLSVIGRV